VTSASQPGKPTPIRLVGTYDENGTLLFSQGYKNFTSKMECNWCHLRRPMMHRYAMAKKGETPDFGEKIFCSVACFRRRERSPFQETPGGLQPDGPTC
jgi:hypothetical protein